MQLVLMSADLQDLLTQTSKTHVLTALGSIILTSFMVKRMYKAWRLSKAKEKIRREQNRCKKKLEKLRERLNLKGLALEDRREILSLSLPELQAKLQSGEITAVAALRAYQSAAMEVNDRINAVTEPIDEAESIAATLDSTRGPKGPLHGIPVSVKESIYLKGYDCTGGFSWFLCQPADKDAVIIQVLKKLGAVPFVRTNIPQSLMTVECSNPIYGRTNNPYDWRRNPGGSSGGEGALLAAGGSIVGIGTDIGGSIRIPSNNCGVTGLKPTAGRLSYKGCLVYKKGKHGVLGSAGPIGHDVDSLVLMMKSLLIPDMWRLDPITPVMPFRVEEYESNRPLTIGYFVTTGYVDAVPASVRGVMEAKAILEGCGHKLIQFTPPGLPDAILNHTSAVIMGDGGKYLTQFLEYDVWDPAAKIFYLMSMPSWTKVILAAVIYVFMSPIIGRYVWKTRGMRSVFDWWTQLGKLEDWQDEVIAAMQKQGIDVLLSPGFAAPAMFHGTTCDAPGCLIYTMIYNVLNFPAGSLPVTTVTKEDADNLESKYIPRNRDERLIKESCRDGLGLPVNVQCASVHYKEELVLRVMKEIQTEVQNKKKSGDHRWVPAVIHSTYS